MQKTKQHHQAQAYFTLLRQLIPLKNPHQHVEVYQREGGTEELSPRLEKIEIGIISQLQDDDGSILITGKLGRCFCQSFVSSIFSLCRLSWFFFKMTRHDVYELKLSSFELKSNFSK